MFQRTRTTVVLLYGVLPALLCCFALGCGSDKTYRVSGTVNFDGKPVPQGKIYFKPDRAKGNSGPDGYADIKDGAFDTSVKPGQGSPGGAVIVEIHGFKEIPPQGDVTSQPLFYPYQEQMEMPKEATTKTFNVPADAAKKPLAPKGGDLITP